MSKSLVIDVSTLRQEEAGDSLDTTNVVAETSIGNMDVMVDDVPCNEIHDMKKCETCLRVYEANLCAICFRETKQSEQPSLGQLDSKEEKQVNSNIQNVVVTDNHYSTENKSCDSEKICRICLDNIDEEDMIAPCKCSGSTKYAHEGCLLKWFFKSSKKSCEVCLSSVNVTPVGYKPVQEWRLPDNGCDFIVYLFGLYFLIMVIFTGMITWIATQGCTSPVCVTLYCVCGIAVFYFFYCCGCVEYSRRYWKSLLSVNKVWRIYGREDSLKNFKHHIQTKNISPVQSPASLENSRGNITPFVIDIHESSNERTIAVGIDNHAVELDEP